MLCRVLSPKDDADITGVPCLSVRDLTWRRTWGTCSGTDERQQCAAAQQQRPTTAADGYVLQLAAADPRTGDDYEEQEEDTATDDAACWHRGRRFVRFDISRATAAVVPAAVCRPWSITRLQRHGAGGAYTVHQSVSKGANGSTNYLFWTMVVCTYTVLSSDP